MQKDLARSAEAAGGFSGLVITSSNADAAYRDLVPEDLRYTAEQWKYSGPMVRSRASKSTATKRARSGPRRYPDWCQHQSCATRDATRTWFSCPAGAWEACASPCGRVQPLCTPALPSAPLFLGAHLQWSSAATA